MIPYGETKIKSIYVKCCCFLCRYNPKDLRRVKKKRARQRAKREIRDYGTD